MKLVTFDRDSSPKIGVHINDNVVDLGLASQSSGLGALPSTMLEFIQGGESMWHKGRQVLDWATNSSGDFLLDGSQVRIRAPISNPPKMICVALNYQAHADETGVEAPNEPMLFSKFPSVIIGPGDAIKIPRQSDQVDYEIELAAVIGIGGRHIPEENALNHVFGYTIMNDVSCREYQRRWSQWLVGKSFDTFAPMGPSIVTADEVPDPHNLSMVLSINGDVMQSSNTSDMIFNIPRLIAFASSIFTLESGDVLLTGTPPGVGAARQPPRWIRPGDLIQMEIDTLGTLCSLVESE